MNPENGVIHYGTKGELKAIEEKEGVKLLYIPEQDLPKLNGMTDDQRRCYTKQLQKRRRRAAEARKTRRKQRK